MPSLNLQPAYGRKYRSRKEVLKAWDDGRDFHSSQHYTYCSSRDSVRFKVEGYTHVEFYNGDGAFITLTRL